MFRNFGNFDRRSNLSYLYTYDLKGCPSDFEGHLANANGTLDINNFIQFKHVRVFRFCHTLFYYSIEYCSGT